MFLATVMVLVTACLLAAAAATARPRRHRAPVCRPRAGQVVVRSGRSVLFLKTTGPDDGEYGPPRALFACTRTRQAAVRIDAYSDGDIPAISHPLIGARFGALWQRIDDVVCEKYMPGDPACVTVSLTSFNLRTGRVRARAAGDVAQAPSALVMTSQGWIAFVSPTGGSRGQLEAVDSHGQRLLDAGPVDPASLTVSGATVSWTSAGAAHTAALG